MNKFILYCAGAVSLLVVLATLWLVTIAVSDRLAGLDKGENTNVAYAVAFIVLSVPSLWFIRKVWGVLLKDIKAGLR